jgi:hypothetical protein
MASRRFPARLRDAEPLTFLILRCSGVEVVELDDPEAVLELEAACCPSANNMLWRLYGLAVDGARCASRTGA